VSTIKASKPVLGFAAWSGTGKTTLLTQVIPQLRAHGIRIAMIKHAHHKFDVDKPGKDSYELRKSGASQMLICSSRRSALMTDYEEEREPLLSEQLEQINMDSCDLILVEGFKHEDFPKIELHRPSVGKPLICTEDDSIIALATDEPDSIKASVDLLPLNEPEAITAYIMYWLSQQNEEK